LHKLKFRIMEPFKVFAIKDYSPQKDYEIMLQAGKIYTVDKQEENSYQVVSEGGRCGWAPSDNFYLLKTVEKNKSGKSCNLCNKTIEEDYITSDEKDYHTKCFECAGCKKILIGLPYINNNDNIFCESCSKENDKICADCNEKISGTYVTALDKYFHPEHFVCSHCKKQFTETYHTIMGKALCSDCFNAQTNN
ncbi:Transforming growth factor beta-1-induced transcript 1 protein, partial [Bonamia ostreae]